MHLCWAGLDSPMFIGISWWDLAVDRVHAGVTRTRRLYPSLAHESILQKLSDVRSLVLLCRVFVYFIPITVRLWRMTVVTSSDGVLPWTWELPSSVELRYNSPVLFDEETLNHNPFIRTSFIVVFSWPLLNLWGNECISWWATSVSTSLVSEKKGFLLSGLDWVLLCWLQR